MTNIVRLVPPASPIKKRTEIEIAREFIPLLTMMRQQSYLIHSCRNRTMRAALVAASFDLFASVCIAVVAQDHDSGKRRRKNQPPVV